MKLCLCVRIKQFSSTTFGAFYRYLNSDMLNKMIYFPFQFNSSVEKGELKEILR